MTTVPPLALVTGASSGIGFRFAELLAADGYDLVIVADDPEIFSAADNLKNQDLSVRPIQADLRTEIGIQNTSDAISSGRRPLSVAVLNAGIGRGGTFVDTPLQDTLAVIDTNVRATVHLTKIVLEEMATHGQGRILFTSSVASLTPGPYQAAYNASKTFVQSFAQALQSELHDSPITVTSLMPGPTQTNFFHRAHMDDTAMARSKKDDPAEVARQGYSALMKGRRRVVAASPMSKMLAIVATFIPDPVKAAAHRLAAKPRRRNSKT